MKVLITGITGFVGRNLRRHLPDGHEYFFLKGNLNDLSGVKKEVSPMRPDVCVHLAWEGIPDYGYEVSVKNLKNSVDFFRFLVQECGCHKIVSTGSCWEYGKNFGACAEADGGSAGSYFVWAKRSLCALGLTMAQQEKIDFIWLRFFYVYGPGQRDGALIPSLVRALRKNEPPSIRTPLDANDFVHVDDAVQAITKSVFSEIPSGLYNIGSGVSVPVWRVCAIIEQVLNKDTRYSEELKKAPCAQMTDFWADTRSASMVLGWQAKKSLENGIREYLKGQEAWQ